MFPARRDSLRPSGALKNVWTQRKVRANGKTNNTLQRTAGCRRQVKQKEKGTSKTKRGQRRLLHTVESSHVVPQPTNNRKRERGRKIEWIKSTPQDVQHFREKRRTRQEEPFGCRLLIPRRKKRKRRGKEKTVRIKVHKVNPYPPGGGY